MPKCCILKKAKKKKNVTTKAKTNGANNHCQTAALDWMNIRSFVTTGLIWMACIERGNRCRTNQEAAAEKRRSNTCRARPGCTENRGACTHKTVSSRGRNSVRHQRKWDQTCVMCVRLSENTRNLWLAVSTLQSSSNVADDDDDGVCATTTPCHSCWPHSANNSLLSME